MKTLITCIFIISISLFYQPLSAQTGEYLAGNGAGENRTIGDYNTFIGDSAGFTLTSGHNNLLMGYKAGYSQTTPSDNTFIGFQAGLLNIIGTDNTFVGKQAGMNNTATDNTFIGSDAGLSNTTGFDNTFIGEQAGKLNTTGSDNTYIGQGAGATGFSNEEGTGSDNTFVGSYSGYQITTGYQNSFFGNEAGWDITDGHHNTCLGDSAGTDIGSTHHNTFIGASSGANTEHADYNTFVGSYAGWDNNRTNETNNANYNTYLGYRTGYTNREGQYNVLLGALTDFSSTAMNGNGNTNSYNIGIGYDALISGERNYACVIGAQATVSSSNSFVIGGTSATNRMSVGIGTTAPNQNASLDLAENDKGFLITRMTASEKTTFEALLATTDEGMMVYDSTNNNLSVWDGTQWISSGVQNLGLTNNTLSISNGSSVDLSGYLDNTDGQTLSLSSTTLSISNGNSVDLSSFATGTDDQNLTDATLTGTTLQIGIENGTPVSVDLASMLSDINTLLKDQQEKIEQLEADVAYLKNNIVSSSALFVESPDVSLSQNVPNPTNGSTRIQLDIPYEINTAGLLIYDMKGVIHDKISITERGVSYINYNASGLTAGTYYYSLIIDNRNAGSKKMVVVN